MHPVNFGGPRPPRTSAERGGVVVGWCAGQSIIFGFVVFLNLLLEATNMSWLSKDIISY